MNAAQKRLWDDTIMRDEGLCIQCGMQGSSIHHVIGRGKGGWQPKAMCVLCVDCHGRANGLRAQGILLAEMRRRYDYDYSDDPFVGILRVHDDITRVL